MPDTRLAEHGDLGGLLSLFAVSEVSASAKPIERAERIWRETLASENSFVFVRTMDTVLTATCMLVTAPNLLREGRSHGFLENVVTHPEYRGQGHGRAVVSAALDHAWHLDCYHVLMQSGRADPRVDHFYESLGFKPGLRAGYVAMRPRP